MEQVIRLRPPKIETVNIELVGTSSLITNKWSEKAKKMMKDRQSKAATQPKAARRPKKEFEEFIYRTVDGAPGGPSVAFKGAALRAGT